MKEFRFWKNEEGKVSISNAKLLKFLEVNGFMRIRLSTTNFMLVRKLDNKIRQTSESEIIGFVNAYLIKHRLYNVQEQLVKGIGNYISSKKLCFLPTEDLPNDRDSRDKGIMYFKNCYCEITKDEINIKNYSELPYVIWENRLVDFEYAKPYKTTAGQFEQFCMNITGKDEARFEVLKTILGYLVHRSKERGETKAVILYDQNMMLNDRTHGGTGKTLLTDAISMIRELEKFDGKSIKSDSWFKNQRINITTDVVVYDDLNKNVSLEMFYSMLTTGVEIEKKRKDAFYIPFELSPKIVITSNYPVKGPGGSSDKRRRYEFELANYYNEKFTPEVDFKNRFFDKYWGNDEWSKFYEFLMRCLQSYLNKGLLEAKKINIKKNSLIEKTSREFVEFANDCLEFNTEYDKREIEYFYNELYLENQVSPHRFTKWLKEYCQENDASLELISTGGKYKFKMIEKVVKDDKNSL
ncbi:DUF5906 domain-containing protein [Tenacibaculum discolor]|uniref:DUF5906 domain-containing protein n=1 Tax=Tenacibaculum discolor TaxID=361581 RepID=UPI000EAC72AD|nr:DUF5906 domain-containing protein [Tenacibaculum discolor]RLJ97926.1 hypothetical protein C8N27_3028 [Tenacibaculum discolor]